MKFMKNLLMLMGLALMVTACSADVAPSPTAAEVTLDSDALPAASALEAQGLSPRAGVLGKYFRASGFVDFDRLKIDPSINRVWLPRPAAQGFYSVRWNALLTGLQAETYTFSLTAIGNARLYLDGTLLIDLAALQSPKTQEATYTLQGSGRSSALVVEYDHASTLPGLVRLEWRSAHQRREVIPTRALTATDLTADCPSVLSKGCLPKFGIASSDASFALIGPGSIHGSLGIENRSEIYPLNVQVASQAFPRLSGQYQVPPSAILPVDLPFECTVPGATAGTISVTRVEDGAAVQTAAFLGCGETLPGPVGVSPPANP